MAYQFKTNYSTKGLGARDAGASSLDDNRKALQKSLDSNRLAEKKLRETDITNRQELWKTIGNVGDVSYDKQFNADIRNDFNELVNEYSNIKNGMTNGTVDPAVGSAYLSDLDEYLDLFQKFSVSAKSVEDQINEAGGMAQGATGSFIQGGGVNDIKTLNMIHEMFNDPRDVQIVRENNGMYLKRRTANEDGSYDTINAQELVAAVKEGKNLGEQIQDLDVLATEAFKTINASGISNYKVEKVFQNGVTGIGYKRDKLEQAYATKNPWQTVIDDPIQANGAWEYLEHLTGYKEEMSRNKNFNNGVWIGNELDDNGEPTKDALDQQEYLKELLTKFSIDRSIPSDSFVTTKYVEPEAEELETGTEGETIETGKALEEKAYNIHTRNTYNVKKLEKDAKDEDGVINQEKFDKGVVAILNSALQLTEGDVDSFRYEDGSVKRGDNVIKLPTNMQELIKLVNTETAIFNVGKEDSAELTKILTELQNDPSIFKIGTFKANKGLPVYESFSDYSGTKEPAY